MVAARPSNSTETQMAGRVRVRITRGSGGGKDTLFVTAMAISDPSRSGAGAARRAVRAVLRCFSPRRLAATAAFLGGLARQGRRRRAEPRLTVAGGIDSLYETLTGVGWYLYEILDHLARRDDLRLRLYGQGLAPAATPGGAGGPLLPSLASPLAPILALPAGPAIEHVTYTAPDGLVIPPWRADQWLRRAAPLLMAADRNRVLFGPNFLLPPLFRFAAGARVVAIHDLAFRRLPWAVRPDTARALAERLERTLLEADLLLTDSLAVADEVAAAGVAPARVRAIHLGPGHLPPPSVLAAASPPAGTPDRYGLFVGTLEPRKNLATLLTAWRELRRDSGAPPLLICGPRGWRAREVRRLPGGGVAPAAGRAGGRGLAALPGLRHARRARRALSRRRGRGAAVALRRIRNAGDRGAGGRRAAGALGSAGLPRGGRRRGALRARRPARPLARAAASSARRRLPAPRPGAPRPAARRPVRLAPRRRRHRRRLARSGRRAPAVSTEPRAAGAAGTEPRATWVAVTEPRATWVAVAEPRAAWVAVAAIVFAFAWGLGEIRTRTGWDDTWYLLQASSLVEDGDLDLRNDALYSALPPDELRRFLTTTLPSGTLKNTFSIGPAVLWLPAYAAGMPWREGTGTAAAMRWSRAQLA